MFSSWQHEFSKLILEVLKLVSQEENSFKRLLYYVTFLHLTSLQLDFDSKQILNENDWLKKVL